jgi:hypothetical protein
VKSLNVKYPLFLSDFKETLVFSADFRKKETICQISSKSVQWEPSYSMRTDRRADGAEGHDKANSRFSRFYEGA